MGTITIQFSGICVNFRQPLNPDLPVLHRTVLINASLGATLMGAAIPPHFGILTGTVNPMPLEGVQLRILHPVTLGCVYDPSFLDLPELTRLIAGAGEILGPPSKAVLLGSNPDLVAAYFDFDSGVFSACTTNNAAGVTVEVVTNDDPVQLQVTPFPRSPFPEPEPFLLTFPSGMTIAVQNVAPQEGGTPSAAAETSIAMDVHFYLSYLTARTLPAQLVIPSTGPAGCVELRMFAGPGCSDSSYP